MPSRDKSAGDEAASILSTHTHRRSVRLRLTPHREVFVWSVSLGLFYSAVGRAVAEHQRRCRAATANFANDLSPSEWRSISRTHAHAFDHRTIHRRYTSIACLQAHRDGMGAPRIGQVRRLLLPGHKECGQPVHEPPFFRSMRMVDARRLAQRCRLLRRGRVWPRRGLDGG